MIFYHILYMCATICCVWLNGIEGRLPNIAINIYKLFLSFKCAKRVYMYIIHEFCLFYSPSILFVGINDYMSQ